MADRATRQALIESAVREGGAVPTIRAMQRRLQADGVAVSIKTIATDYRALGLRSNARTGRKPTGGRSVAFSLRLSLSTYDACCRLGLQRGVSVASIVRNLVSTSLKKGLPPPDDETGPP